jgi:hypothetical protein
VALREIQRGRAVKADAIGWGIGLILIGAAFTTLGCRFLVDHRGIAENYYRRMSSNRGLFPRRRNLDEVPFDSFRRAFGIPIVAFGLLFIALAVYGFAKG